MTDKATDTKASTSSRSAGPRTATTLEEAQEVGFLGVEVDPTPDENYSLQTPSDAPTPETDPGAHATARDAAGIGLGKFGKTGGKS